MLFISLFDCRWQSELDTIAAKLPEATATLEAARALKDALESEEAARRKLLDEAAGIHTPPATHADAHDDMAGMDDAYEHDLMGDDLPDLHGDLDDEMIFNGTRPFCSLQSHLFR